MTQNPPDMKIRLSAELRRNVEAAAKQNNRTLNSEIVSRLEASFHAENASRSLPGDDLEERVKAAMAKVLTTLSDDDLDYLVERLAKRLGLSETVELQEGGSRMLLERLNSK